MGKRKAKKRLTPFRSVNSFMIFLMKVWIVIWFGVGEIVAVIPSKKLHKLIDTISGEGWLYTAEKSEKVGKNG